MRAGRLTAASPRDSQSDEPTEADIRSLKVMQTVMRDHVKSALPKMWATLFEDAAKQAFQIKYMFRESIKMASTLFQNNVNKMNDADDAKKLFDFLVAEALKEYGAKGLVDGAPRQPVVVAPRIASPSIPPLTRRAAAHAAPV